MQHSTTTSDQSQAELQTRPWGPPPGWTPEGYQVSSNNPFAESAAIMNAWFKTAEGKEQSRRHYAHIGWLKKQETAAAEKRLDRIHTEQFWAGDPFLEVPEKIRDFVRYLVDRVTKEKSGNRHNALNTNVLLAGRLSSYGLNQQTAEKLFMDACIVNKLDLTEALTTFEWAWNDGVQQKPLTLRNWISSRVWRQALRWARQNKERSIGGRLIEQMPSPPGKNSLPVTSISNDGSVVSQQFPLDLATKEGNVLANKALAFISNADLNLDVYLKAVYNYIERELPKYARRADQRNNVLRYLSATLYRCAIERHTGCLMADDSVNVLIPHRNGDPGTYIDSRTISKIIRILNKIVYPNGKHVLLIVRGKNTGRHDKTTRVSIRPRYTSEGVTKQEAAEWVSSYGNAYTTRLRVHEASRALVNDAEWLKYLEDHGLAEGQGTYTPGKNSLPVTSFEEAGGMLFQDELDVDLASKTRSEEQNRTTLHEFNQITTQPCAESCQICHPPEPPKQPVWIPTWIDGKLEHVLRHRHRRKI